VRVNGRRRPQPLPLLGPPMLSTMIMIIGVLLIIGFTFGYTNWAIHQFGRSPCAELKVQAYAGGATTPYDKAIKAEYGRLYVLRCR
jgi:hypothetical protein